MKRMRDDMRGVCEEVQCMKEMCKYAVFEPHAPTPEVWRYCMTCEQSTQHSIVHGTYCSNSYYSYVANKTHS